MVFVEDSGISIAVIPLLFSAYSLYCMQFPCSVFIGKKMPSVQIRTQRYLNNVIPDGEAYQLHCIACIAFLHHIPAMVNNGIFTYE